MAKKSSWKFFDLRSGNIDITRRDSALATIISGIFIALVTVFYFLDFMPAPSGLYALILSMIAIALRVVIYGWERRKTEELDSTFEWIQYIVISGGMAFAIFLVLTLIYDLGFLALFSADWLVQIYWFIALEYIAMLGIGLVAMYLQIKNKKWERVAMDFGFFLLPLVALFMLMFDFAPPKSVSFYVGLGVNVLALGVLYRSLAKDTRKNVFALISLFSIVSQGIIFVLLDPADIFATSSIVPIIAGQAAPVNFFSYVWFIFFQSPSASIMIALMTFGAVVTIFAKALGDLNPTSSVAIGAVIIVVPPLIIIMEIFSGAIPPPTLLVDVLGSGVASFIFAIAEVGVFVIVSIILLTFTGMIERFA